ncbi:MAG: hypothetical protein HYW69_02175 [Candidatus Nealsonbacteria bacterium]|nr:hypothetical protein [Candidatus Nealsonbacteria bacterium]
MFHLSIKSLDKNIFEGEAESLTLPSTDGELTILEDHIPLIATLKEGKLWFRAGREKPELSIRSGVLEVSQEKVIVLVNI